MGRFFQTTPTQFTQDFIYQPPWELIQQAAAKKQQQYDNALATSKLFGDIPIQHLQGVDDVANVKEKQRYYAESADMIAKAIQNDPSKVNQYMSSLEALGKELSVDMKQGDLSKIQNSAISFKAWQDDEGNKEMKKADPARYAAAEKTFLSRYINAGGNSISQGFKGEQITKDVDWDKLLDSVKNIQANEFSQESSGASGGYIYKNKADGTIVTADKIQQHIISRLLADPSNKAALKQSQEFGMAKYYNEETGDLDFTASGFAPIMGYANSNAYSKRSSSQTMSEDGTYNTTRRLAQDESQYQRTMANSNYKWNVDRADKLEAEANKGKLTEKDLAGMRKDIYEETDPNIKALKQQDYDNMVGVNFNRAVEKKISFTDIYGAANNQKLLGVGDVVGQARSSARNNTKMNPKERELAIFIDSQIASGKVKNEEDLKNAVSLFTQTSGQTAKVKNKFNVDPNSKFGKATKQSTLSSVYNNNLNFAKNYVNKQNNFIKNNSNLASSNKIFEVPSVQASQTGAKIIESNPGDFMFVGSEPGAKPSVLSQTFSSEIGGMKGVRITGVTSGQSYGPIGLEVEINGKKGFVLPRGSSANGINTQTLINVMAGGLNSNSGIRKEFQTYRTADLQEAESRAKLTDSGTSVFSYKAGNKDYRIELKNGQYTAYDKFANPISPEPAIDIQTLATFINMHSQK